MSTIDASLDAEVEALFSVLRLKLPAWKIGKENFALFLTAPDGISWWKVRAASNSYRPVVLLSRRVDHRIPVSTTEHLSAESAIAAFHARRGTWEMEVEATQ